MNQDKIIQYYMINDELDLNKIVLDYTNYIHTIISNMTNGFLTNEDLEEIISDVFLVIWKNKDKLDKNAILKPYIAGVTKNIIRNRLRNNKVTEEIPEFFSDNLDLECVVEGKDEYNIISVELEKMGEDSKIFIMFYYNGMKSKDIAKKCGLTEFNVNTKLHRIRKRLKKALSERGYNYAE